MCEGLCGTEANFGLVTLGQLEWERESLRPVEISIKAVELDVSRQISMHFEQYNCLLKLWGYLKAFLTYAIICNLTFSDIRNFTELYIVGLYN